MFWRKNKRTELQIKVDHMLEYWSEENINKRVKQDVGIRFIEIGMVEPGMNYLK